MQLSFLARLLAPLTSGPAVPQPLASEEISKDPIADLEEDARGWLRALGCADLAARLQVRWSARMRSTAGTATAARALIALNPRLKAFGAEEIDRTLRHELAHLLAHHRAGRRRVKPHGPEWRQACKDLGLSGEKRCHELPLPRRHLAPRHFYRCVACGQELRRVRPLRGRSACLECCRRHNRGRYDERFRFKKMPPPVV